jgi:cytochrome c-type biogenesis protein
VADVAFGFGWTPCIGPVLTSVLALAATREGVGRGAALLLAYSLGLGIPFLVTGLAMSRLTGALSWVKRHFTAITAISAASLAFFGVILALNRLVWLTTQLKAALDALGLGRLVNLG